MCYHKFVVTERTEETKKRWLYIVIQYLYSLPLWPSKIGATRCGKCMPHCGICQRMDMPAQVNVGKHQGHTHTMKNEFEFYSSIVPLWLPATHFTGRGSSTILHCQQSSRSANYECWMKIIIIHNFASSSIRSNGELWSKYELGSSVAQMLGDYYKKKIVQWSLKKCSVIINFNNNSLMLL